MTVNKRKKSSRYRAHTTHGKGSMKKRRGAGNRGGRGRAGSGKRADQKKPSYWKEETGKFGFHSVHSHHIEVLNIRDLEEHRPLWERLGKVKKEGNMYVVDLSVMGYEKLLSAGSPKNSWVITVGSVSENARQKIEKAGGSITKHVQSG